MAEGTREQEDLTRFFTQMQETVEHALTHTTELSLRVTEYGAGTQGFRGLLGLQDGCTNTCLLVPSDRKEAPAP